MADATNHTVRRRKNYNEGFSKRKSLTSDAANIVKFTLPLNSYSYFNAFKNNIHPNSEKINFTIENDNNMIHRKTAVGACKVILAKFRLWVPTLTFNGAGMEVYAENYLTPKPWSYLNEHYVKEDSELTESFRTIRDLRKSRHVFVWIISEGRYYDQENNSFTFDTFRRIGANGAKLSQAHLEINNNKHYPKIDLQYDNIARLYKTLLSYNSSYNNFLSGKIIDRTNYEKLHGILYFDLRNQEEDTKDSTVTLTFRYKLNEDPGSKYRLIFLILHEKEIELYISSGKLLLKA